MLLDFDQLLHANLEMRHVDVKLLHVNLEIRHVNMKLLHVNLEMRAPCKSQIAACKSRDTPFKCETAARKISRYVM